MGVGTARPPGPLSPNALSIHLSGRGLWSPTQDDLRLCSEGTSSLRTDLSVL